MSYLKDVFFTEGLGQSLLQLALVVLGVAGAIYLVRLLLGRLISRTRVESFGAQVTLFVLGLVGVVVIILALPIDEARRSSLLSIFGLLLSGSMALASTTFLGNILGGLLLRALRNFTLGDFIRCEGHFGRVTERGIFHTEIATEDRNLTTLPNMFLVSRPVTVVRASGTILTASVSLGYDVSWNEIRRLLIVAAERAELEDGFVQIDSLEDHSVVYRVGGLLRDVKGLLSARTRLRAAMLDELHSGGIEIVSPSFMNTRAIQREESIVPATVHRNEPTAAAESTQESVAFDKAEAAGALGKLEDERVALEEELRALDQLPAEEKPAGEARRPEIVARLETLLEDIERSTADLEASQE